MRTALDPATYAATFAATIGGGPWQAGLQDGSRFRPGTVYVKPAVNGAAVWNGSAIAPLGDAALGPLDFTLPVAQLDTASRVPLVLDVLAKQVSGPNVNVDGDLDNDFDDFRRFKNEYVALHSEAAYYAAVASAGMLPEPSCVMLAAAGMLTAVASRKVRRAAPALSDAPPPEVCSFRRGLQNRLQRWLGRQLPIE